LANRIPEISVGMPAFFSFVSESKEERTVRILSQQILKG